MQTSLLIAGSGGQGILFFGKILAFAGMNQEKNVTWFPSYGAEMRGGTATCTVIISDSLIGSPVIRNSDILIAMNSASLDKYQESLKKNGVLVFDSSLIKKPIVRRDIASVPVPATHIASSLSNTRSANMVLLGALISRTGILDKSSVIAVFQGLHGTAGKNRGRSTRECFMKGYEYIETQKSRNS